MEKCLKALVLLLLACLGARAQSLATKGVTSAGGTLAVGDLVLDYTLGEVVSGFIGSSAGSLVQGILQPDFWQSSLPVRWVSVSGEVLEEGIVRLTWETANEHLNRGFIVERRKATITAFREVGYVPSSVTNGESSKLLTYSWIDNVTFEGNVYYRLRQTDRDGTFSYSRIISVVGRSGQELQLSVWPIPSSGTVNIQLKGGSNEILQVYQMDGRVVKEVSVSGDVPVSFDLLTAGTYVLRVKGHSPLVRRVIIK